MNKKEIYEKDKEWFYKKYIQSDEDKLMEKIHSNAKKGLDNKSIKKRNKIKKTGIYLIIITISLVIGLIIGILI